jgi:hypothetical protein
VVCRLWKDTRCAWLVQLDGRNVTGAHVMHSVGHRNAARVLSGGGLQKNAVFLEVRHVRASNRDSAQGCCDEQRSALLFVLGGVCVGVHWCIASLRQLLCS